MHAVTGMHNIWQSGWALPVATNGSYTFTVPESSVSLGEPDLDARSMSGACASTVGKPVAGVCMTWADGLGCRLRLNGPFGIEAFSRECAVPVFMLQCAGTHLPVFVRGQPNSVW